MKITFTCKLTMTDEFEDSEVERVCQSDEIINSIMWNLKYNISEKGAIDISDYLLTTE